MLDDLSFVLNELFPLHFSISSDRSGRRDDGYAMFIKRFIGSFITDLTFNLIQVVSVVCENPMTSQNIYRGYCL